MIYLIQYDYKLFEKQTKVFQIFKKIFYVKVNDFNFIKHEKVRILEQLTN